MKLRDHFIDRRIAYHNPSARLIASLTGFVKRAQTVFGHLKAQTLPISYPEPSGSLVSRATPGRLWGHRILLPQDFCGKTMETVTEEPIKKIEFFRCPQSLSGVAPLTKKPEDSGYVIETRPIRSACAVDPSLPLETYEEILFYTLGSALVKKLKFEIGITKARSKLFN